MNKLKPNVSPGQAYKSSRAHTNMLLSQQPKPANQANSSQLRITNVTIVPRKRNQPQQMKKQRSVPALLQQSHFLNRCASNTNLGNDKKQAPKKHATEHCFFRDGADEHADSGHNKRIA